MAEENETQNYELKAPEMEEKPTFLKECGKFFSFGVITESSNCTPDQSRSVTIGNTLPIPTTDSTKIVYGAQVSIYQDMGVIRKSYQPAVTISQQVGTTGNITASITPLSQREYFNIGCKFNL